MAAVPMSYRATLYDLANKRTFEVFLEGDASITGLGVGGGPMPGEPPFTGDPGYGKPPPTWGGGGQPYPPGGGGGGGPGDGPPGFWGPNDPRPNPPIAFPPGWVGGVPPLPPNVQPPTTPPPGTVTPVPPPPGSGGWPVAGIVPPEYMIVQYPGVGPVVVTPPPHAEPAA